MDEPDPARRPPLDRLRAGASRALAAGRRAHRSFVAEPRLRWRRWLRRQPWWRARPAEVALLSVGATTLLTFLLGLGAFDGRGIPHEEARVVAVRPATTTAMCRHVSREEELVVLSVPSPRPGLPDMTRMRTCPDAFDVGDSVMIIRRVAGSGEAEVAPAKAGEIPFVAPFGGVVVAVLIVLGRMLDGWLTRTWRRWRRRARRR